MSKEELSSMHGSKGRFSMRQCSTTDYGAHVTRQGDGRWKLDLNQRDFTEFPVSVLELDHIEELELCQSSIRSIPDGIMRLSNLKVLKLKANELQEFPSNLCGLEQLQELDLSHNVLQQVCSTISLLKQLQVLNLCDTGLEGELCKDIGELDALKELNLSMNHLSALPVSMQSLTKLSKINLSRNAFEEAPAVLSELGSLLVLDISYNSLKTFNTKVGHLQNLDLEKNCLNKFPDGVCNFQELERLDLAKNGIRRVPECIKNLSKLKELWLEDNRLSQFPEVVCQLETLETLVINGNNVKAVPAAIANLKHLKHLDVGHCGLKVIPLAFCSLRELRWLCLSRNRVRELPSQLTELNQLTFLYVHENPLVKPPLVVCQRGVRTVFNYLKEMAQERTVHQKLIFLGSENAGKTTLCRVLISGKHQPSAEIRDKTIVMDQKTWKPEAGTTVQMFDFGGDESYQVVQHFFLDSHALILLVVNLHTYQHQDYHKHVGSWIQILQARAPGALVHLVGTHIDQCTQQDTTKKKDEILHEMQSQEEVKVGSIEDALSAINLTESTGEKLKDSLKARLKLPESMHLVSSTSPKLDNIAPLKATIVDDAKHHGRAIPTSWQSLYEAMRRSKVGESNGFITLQDLITIDKLTSTKRSKSTVDQTSKAQSSTPTSEDVQVRVHAKDPVRRRLSESEVCSSRARLRDILAFFHSIGELVWFENNEKISNYVFHKQEFLINLLKAIFPGHLAENLESVKHRLTHTSWDKAKENLSQRGVMSRDVLKALWSQMKLTDEVLDTLIQLLQQLDLCYRLPSKDPQVTDLCFPWSLESSSTTSDARFDEPLADGVHRFILEFAQCTQFPPSLCEKIAVRMHHHVKDVDSIVQTKGDFSARIRNTKVFLQHHASDSKCIRLAVEGEAVSELWLHLIELSEAIKKVLEDWPGLHYETWLLCPHCVSAGNVADAYKFQGIYVRHEPPDDEEFYTCRKAGSVPVSFAFLKTVAGGIPSHEKLSTVAMKVGKNWRWLGRALKLEEPHLDAIQHKEDDVLEMCYQVLLKWMEMRGSQATCAELADALCDKLVKREDLVELIKGTK